MVLQILFCFRLVWEITFREFQRVKDRMHVTASDLSDQQLRQGRKNVCSLRWQKKALDALHKGAEAYMIGVLEDANLLAIHARHVTVQPCDIQLARRIRGNQTGTSQTTPTKFKLFKCFMSLSLLQLHLLLV